MPYIPHSDEDVSRILKTLKHKSVEDMLGVFPEEFRIKGGNAPFGNLKLPKGLSEQELSALMSELSSKNTRFGEYASFLGAGAYNHYIPAVVRALTSRSEFYTSYTPYQPEVSQGTLQAIFEYQTLVCQLTAMDVANASLYDGGSSAAEAVLMARRITGKNKVILSAALHPEYRETVKTYLKATGGDISEVGEALYCTEEGTTLPEAVEAVCGDEPACLVVQHPNFFGCLEDVSALAAFIHKKKGLLIVVVNEAVSLGLLKPPGELGADIAVGEMQSFGNALNFGGPYLGFMAVKSSFVRQMPGRLIGATVDKSGNRAFCLTFATREQHIRRERATSNICTNHGLCALAAAIHMVSLGAAGLKDTAVLNLSKANYLKEKLAKIKRVLPSSGVSIAFNAPTFNEFTIKIAGDVDKTLRSLLGHRVIGGLALKRFYPALDKHLLVAVTEMNTREELDGFAGHLAL
ncbi:MAG: aminomethyl-transferring glycine dehydrogenase subunit GcvPA [Deltaproteobacteria bacterium]|nr:aminomethyl-transferring glycine dehydrogenase subunit GcvPA [Deltaproteobacteria bacterium]